MYNIEQIEKSSTNAASKIRSYMDEFDFNKFKLNYSGLDIEGERFTNKVNAELEYISEIAVNNLFYTYGLLECNPNKDQSRYLKMATSQKDRYLSELKTIRSKAQEQLSRLYL